MDDNDGERKEFYSRIRPALRARLKSLGLSQKDLCQELGKSEAWLSNIIWGKRAVEAFDLARIAKALGITPNDLLLHDHNPPEAPMPPDDELLVVALRKHIPDAILDRLIEMRKNERREDQT